MAMATYIFEHEETGERREAECPMGEIENLSTVMALAGWRRVFTPPLVTVIPDFNASMEESERVFKRREDEAAKERHDPLWR